MPQRRDPRWAICAGRRRAPHGGGSVSLGGRRPTAARRSAGGPRRDCSSRGPARPACHQLANVIISAIPAPSAGARPESSTAQQLGRAIGIGVFGDLLWGAARVRIPRRSSRRLHGSRLDSRCARSSPHLQSAAVRQTFERRDKAGGCQVGATASTRREAVEDAASQVIALE